MRDFPRSRNGWVDTGAPLRGVAKRDCPNCGSDRYKETISREHCPDCGLVCDYWGNGTNSVYEEYTERLEQERKRLQAEKEKKWRDEWPDQYGGG